MQLSQLGERHFVELLLHHALPFALGSSFLRLDARLFAEAGLDLDAEGLGEADGGRIAAEGEGAGGSFGDGEKGAVAAR